MFLKRVVICLNPCLNGRWFLTVEPAAEAAQVNGLNPCLNGRWFLTRLGGKAAYPCLCLNPCLNGRWFLTNNTVYAIDNRDDMS